jgi:hypothetical protein
VCVEIVSLKLDAMRVSDVVVIESRDVLAAAQGDGVIERFDLPAMLRLDEPHTRVAADEVAKNG